MKHDYTYNQILTYVTHRYEDMYISFKDTTYDIIMKVVTFTNYDQIKNHLCK